jgi:hypothetical protein
VYNNVASRQSSTMDDRITTLHDVAAAVIERRHPIDPVTL